MNTELIISRANELKEVKTKQKPIYIKTDRERDAVVWMMKEHLKTEGIFPSENEIEDFVDLFRPIFSLNIILAIQYYEVYGHKLKNVEGKDEIEKIIRVLMFLDKNDIEISKFIGVSLLLYDYDNSKK
jgi:hypothetical protein